MSPDDRLSTKLVFNRTVSPSERVRIRDFWKFLDKELVFEPYHPRLEPLYIEPRVSEVRESKRKDPRGTIWYEGLKLFKELGLDRVALAAKREVCKLCNETSHGCPDYEDTAKQSYEELNQDMKSFDKRIRALERANADRRAV